jgi:hypothetical protein
MSSDVRTSGSQRLANSQQGGEESLAARHLATRQMLCLKAEPAVRQLNRHTSGVWVAHDVKRRDVIDIHPDLPPIGEQHICPAVDVLHR